MPVKQWGIAQKLTTEKRAPIIDSFVMYLPEWTNIEHYWVLILREKKKQKYLPVCEIKHQEVETRSVSIK